MDFQALVSRFSGVDSLHDYVEVYQKLDQLTPENIAFIATVYGGEIAAALFTLRTISVFATNKLGLCHPNHYHRYPRLVPWRTPFRAYLALRKWYERLFIIGKRSSGGFAGILTVLSMMHTPKKILLGKTSAFEMGLQQPVGINPKRHLFMLAMTGTGKTELLKCIISAYLGSVVLIDPNYQTTDSIRDRDPREWVEFAPYRQNSASINFIDCIKEAMEREGHDAAVIWALRIAEAIIVTPAGARTPYFYNVARQYLAGVILHVITTHPEEDHNLPVVRDLIISGYRLFDENGQEETSASEARQLLLRAMMKNTSYELIAGAASAVLVASGETGGNIWSTLQEETKFLDLPQVRAVSLETTVPLSEIKKRDDLVFVLGAPLYSLRDELSRLSRLLTNMLAYTFEAVPEKKGETLLCVDELPSQQYNPIFELILAAGRSTGLLLLGIAQNVSQLIKLDPQNYKTYIGEADAVWWMGGNHPENRDMLSSILGKKTIVEKDPRTRRKTYREVAVMEPEACSRYLDPNSNNLIVTLAGRRALKLKIMYSFTSLPVYRLAKSKEHGETLLRGLSRFFFDRKIKQINEPEILEEIPTPHETEFSNHEELESESSNVIAFRRPKTD